MMESGISSLMNLNFMDPNTDTSYGSIEELEQAIMAKKQPPSDTGGIMGLVMGGPPKFGGLIEGPGTGTSDSIPGMIYQDGKPVQRAALSNNEFVFTELFSKTLDLNTLNLGTGGNGPYEYLALLKNVVKPIISSIRGKEFFVVLVFYDNDNVKFSENTNRHLSISQPIAGVSPNGSTNVSKEYLSILDATIAKYYPTNKEDILEFLKPPVLVY